MLFRAFAALSAHRLISSDIFISSFTDFFFWFFHTEYQFPDDHAAPGDEQEHEKAD
jgi:hypothetical protein